MYKFDLEAQLKRDEAIASKKLDRLDEEVAELSPELAREASDFVKQVTATTRQKERDILNEFLYKDDAVREVVYGVDNFLQDLKNLLNEIEDGQSISIMEVGERNSFFIQLLPKKEAELWLTLVTLDLFPDEIINILNNLIVSLSEPRAKLRILSLGKEFASTKILLKEDEADYLDGFVFWIELRDILLNIHNVMAGKKKKEKVYFRYLVLKELLKNKDLDISKGLIEDFINGKFSEVDSWINSSLVEAFEEIQEVQAVEEEVVVKSENIVKNEKKSILSKQRIITAISVVVITLTVATITNNQLNQGSSEIERSAQIEEAEEDADEEFEYLDGNRESYITPENSGDFPEGIDWSFEGNPPDGFYITATASRFFVDPSWDIDDYYPSPSRVVSREAEHTDFIMISEGLVRNGFYDIPTPTQGDYRLVSASVGSAETFIQASVDVNNGVTTIHIADLPADYQGNLTLGWERFENPPLASYDEGHLDYSLLIGNIEDLPVEMQALLDSVADLPVDERANAIADFVRTEYIYSLDPSYSEYHTAGQEPGDFIRRTWNRRFLDCDGVNTVLVGLLRASDIPARMAYGYNNSQPLLAVTSSLDKAERHGLAQYYSENRGDWVNLDATPTVVDDYTREKLDKLNGGLGIEGVFDLRALAHLPEMLLYNILHIKDILKANILPISAISIILSYLAPLIIGKGMAKAQRKKVEQLAEYIASQDIGFQESLDNIFRQFIYDKVREKYVIPSFNDTSYHILLSMMDFLTGIPVLFTFKRRGKNIKFLENIVSEISQDGVASLWNGFSELMEKAMGSERQAVEVVLDENTRDPLNKILEEFLLEASSKCAEFCGIGLYMVSLGAKYTNDQEAIVPLLKESNSLEEFFRKVIDGYYDSYLLIISGKSKKFKRRYVNKLPMGKKEFAEELAKSFVPLVSAFEYEENRRRILDNF
jgi:hypothetical protein